MRIEFKASFARDLRKVRGAKLKARVREIIGLVEQASNLQAVEGIRKIKGSDRYYRIRIGDYRIGLSVEGSIVLFVRFLHRKDIYRYFP